MFTYHKAIMSVKVITFKLIHIVIVNKCVDYHVVFIFFKHNPLTGHVDIKMGVY